MKPVLAAIDDSTLVVARGERLPPFDCHCPLLSLPLALRTTLETIPARVPYLSASEDRLRKWRERLPASGRPRVAVAWAGNPAFKDDQTRSIGLARLSPLLSVDGIEFFGIQKDLRSGDRDILGANAHVTHLGDMIEDFGDTAAITPLVNLVISSDTSIVHLAGPWAGRFGSCCNTQLTGGGCWAATIILGIRRHGCFDSQRRVIGSRWSKRSDMS